ncbi:M23 family metallopeptidase [Dysgonomonas sp. 25]|uniref:M23 family metallopeptidase n=1 Tax=Dysgonomonas sp. 25 TaxID=2302933 RepID=UPI0013D16302|nr:M23 family metallopeptidase [Dysgonomonas sp. 25]NDV67668.1 M23 family peptidase [Dysgonomonas sp. 25]
MKKIYYRYNPQTLSYERVYPSAKDRFLTVLRHLATGIFIGFGVFWLLAYVIGSPRKVAQEKEQELMQSQYQLLSKRLDNALNVLGDIQRRDDNMYRAVFHADPISVSIRKSGVGGVGRYQELMELSNPGMIVETAQKMDYLEKQLYVQSNSFDEILDLAKNQKERIRHVPSIQPVSDKDLSRVASGYGMRIDPVYGTRRFHAGMDFTSPTGTPIYVTGDGTVVHADWKPGYGKCIIVDHGYDYQTLYAHMSDYNVTKGQKVTRGDIIGKVGSTGKSTGPHLHYEVRVKGKPDNPAKYYFMDLTPEEYDQMLRISANHGQVMD